MRKIKVCGCRFARVVSRHVGVVAYRSGEDWLFEVWLIVSRFPVFPLFCAVHRGFDDFRALAYVQGRLDEVEELALFEEQDRLEGC